MQPPRTNQNGELAKVATADPGRIADVLPHRAKTPQEALGLSGTGGLFKASLQATVLFGLVIGLLTVVPYFLQKPQDGAKAAAPAPPDEKTDDTTAPAPQPKGTTDPATKTPATPTGPKVQPKDDLLNKLGETGTKSGTPKSKDPFKAGGEDDLPGLK
ncbi:hypothetical protein [Gemmata sp.]|uniref:hypothetical protein n=1 Tax=Gemmata sp. TaxID=1914242 RepID=UPI003F6EE012